MQFTERDINIIQMITKYRFLLARQIRILCGFTGQRACDRRLHKLIEGGFIERKKYLYGIPSLYFATSKAKRLLNLNFITSTVRIEQIEHDILVVDTAIYFVRKGIEQDAIISEREIKHSLGFGNNKHTPDFVYLENGLKTCVEIEISVKAKSTLERNIKANYLKFDKQIWVIDKSPKKLVNYFNEFQMVYDMEIMDIEEVKKHVKGL